MTALKGSMLCIFLLLLWAYISVCSGCIQLPSCQCTFLNTDTKVKGRKVDCAQHPAPFKTLSKKNFPPDTVHLNLAHNALATLKRASFIQLSSLQKLNLNNNRITTIEPGAFDGLQSLKRLDLSHNMIGMVNSSMFSGLPNLEKLILSHNRIATIPDGTFNDLTSLKRIEFGSEYLRCDCHLKWILKWTKTRHVRIPSSTVCALPDKMRKLPLSKLKRKDLQCDRILDLSIFDIRPSESQLVFKGDKLPFECHASVAPGQMDIAWFRSGQQVTTNKSMGVFVHTSHNLDHTIINHRLVVESLDATHAGEWSCVVSTANGNLTKTVYVDVRKPDVTVQCPPVTNRTSKGVYIWEESMAGLLVSQPCLKGGDQGAMATQKCGTDGYWRNLNVSVCSFVRDMTRKLSRFAKVNPSMADIPTLAYGIRKALVTAEKDGEIMDSFDMYYLSRIMSTLLPHAPDDSKICALLVNMASNASAVPQQVVDTAQLETRAPLRIVRIVEEVSRRMNTQDRNMEWMHFSRNIAMIVHNKERILHKGISCAFGRQGTQTSEDLEFSHSSFYCGQLLSQQNSLVHIYIPVLSRDGTQQSQAAKDNIDVSSTSVNLSENSSLSSGIDGAAAPYNTSSPENDTVSMPYTKGLSADFGATSDSRPASYSTEESGESLKNPDGVFPSFPLTANQLEALNISSKFISRFPKSMNITSKNLFNLPSSLNISSKYFFPYANSNTSPKKQDVSPASIDKSNVYMVLFRNGHLFPVIRTDIGDPAFRHGNWVVITPVIAVSLGKSVRNVSNPIVVTFNVADTRRPLKAAYFEFKAVDGYGGWKTDGCEIVKKNGTIITVHVYHPSHLALLQDLSFAYRQAAFPMEPVIYVGSGVCMICMLFLICTFISCFRSIGIPKKVKHAVVNICLSTLFLMATFAFGINRTDVELPCQIVGICIHYLTLCAVFWITITSNIIYKKFIKANRPPEPPPEPIPMPLPPKPILQFYFVGYGVPVIICGITAAVNLNFYAGLQYCFLEWEPSLGAFYAPVALLVAWNLILFMRISCVVRSVPEGGSEVANESDNEIHTNEIELVPSQPDTTTTHNIIAHSNNNNNNNMNNNSYRRRFSQASNDEEDAESIISLPDQERKPITQLRSLVAILFLFIVMWMCGALAIAKPFHLIIPHQELIFSYVYGVMSVLFGIFMITFFCLTRVDARSSWKRWAGFAPPETYAAPLEVAESQTELPPPSPPQTNGSAVKSNSNTNLSLYSQKSSNITKAYNMKNSSKQSNVNLILPNSSELSFDSTQDSFPNFYNPRQNGAAKKFWQKNRQHSKVMNKDVNRELNSSLTDNNSANELNHHRLSQGTSSDANTHLSIEIKFQAKNRQGSKQSSFSGSREIPVHINNHQQMSSKNILGSSCGAISIEHNQMVGLKSNSSDRDQSSSPNNPRNVQQGSNPSLPHHQRSPSAGSLGVGIHPSAFTPVQPRNNTIPRQGEMPEQDGEGKAQQNQESLDIAAGQGFVAHENPHVSFKQLNELENSNGGRPTNPGLTWSPFHCNFPPLPSQPNAFLFNPSPAPHSHQYPYNVGTSYPLPPAPMNPHLYNLNQPHSPLPNSASPSTFMGPQSSQNLPTFNIPPSPYLVQTQSWDQGGKSMSPVSSSSQSARQRRSSFNSWRPLSGGDSSDSSRPRQKRSRSGGSPGRPATHTPRSPVVSDSQAYVPKSQPPSQTGQGTAKQARSVDSDHHSDPTHRKKHQRSDRYSRNKLSSKQRSLGWDEQFKNRASKVNYVYVNHMYRDKVMHKLIKQASESDELASKAFWLPRSASEYERLTQKGFCNMAEDTSSSSDDDSLDNVWILQSSGSDFNKKETSV